MKELIENDVPVYTYIDGKEGGYGVIHQYAGVFQVGAWWEILVPEKVPITDMVNAQHLREPTVKNDERNGTSKTRVKFEQGFYSLQFS